MHQTPRRATKWIAGLAVSALVAASCSPGEGPESIPLPTSPNTTTTTTTTTSTTTTTTTTTTALPPTFEATIRRTTDGIPHISGRNLSDVAFGQGYVSGQDYGCTLLDQILKIRGERSANQGPGGSGENVESDFAWRAIDVIGIAAQDFPAASDQVVEQFEAFASGWNQHLADQGDDGLPGWCVDDEWVRTIEPVEVYAYARSIALLASGANFTDFIAAAQPPVPEAAAFAPDTDTAIGTSTGSPVPDLAAPTAAAPDFSVLRRTDVGSNAWGIGSDRTEAGTGSMLVANPHFPWEGELRFAEVHLTVGDDIDIYGAQLAGLPGVGIGFTDGAAWTHTVSAGHRFTAYTLDLDPESPTTYFVDGEPQEMSSVEHTVQILRPDGTVDAEERTLYSSEYGPIIDFPGVGWSESLVLTYRDANIDNGEFIEFYADMVDVSSLDDLKETHRRHQGVPLFNTVAVGADGRTWYADTSATPNLSAEAELLYLEQRFTGVGLAAAAYSQGVILLNGSDSRFRWEEVEGARDPGLVPWTEMPRTERTDYVFNANDSFWVPSAEFTLTGDYSLMHGEQNVAQSLRTRQNATVLSVDNSLGLAGDDGNFSASEVRDAVFDNTGHSALLLRDDVVAACRVAPLVEVAELVDGDGVVDLPAEAVNIATACNVLASWDGRFDLESSGALLWREVMARLDGAAFSDAGTLFSEPFDASAPLTTPSGFTADPTVVLESLARAVQTLTKAGFGVDSPLGAAQFTERSGTRIPIHGGTGRDGVTNIVTWSGSNSSSEDAPDRGERVSDGGALRGNGHPVNFGSSFVMVVDYSSGAPEASAILTYGQTGLRDTEEFESQTVRFSEKNWRTVLFEEQDILDDPGLSELVIRQP